jgi:hypothetical protein
MALLLDLKPLQPPQHRLRHHLHRRVIVTRVLAQPPPLRQRHRHRHRHRHRPLHLRALLRQKRLYVSVNLTCAPPA